MEHVDVANGGMGPRTPGGSRTDDLDHLLQCLPAAVLYELRQLDSLDSLLEVVLDLGRLPEARFAGREVDLGNAQITHEDIQFVVDRVSPFGGDNRAGIERTLHRISGIRNRSGQLVGLTCRVGRAITGTIRVVEDLVKSGQNILLVGRPGVGKTTMLREVARVLADSEHRRVVVVDTSNEIAGDGDVPHPAIGRARRMQVVTPSRQHAVMIEAVENHMPEVIIIDEMGTEEDARAARTIAERGVQLVATAHGNTLENLLINPTLSDLVGGVQSVTLSDEEAKRRRTQKAILERKAPPTFDVMVEIQNWDRVAVHEEMAKAVDRILRGQTVTPEVRWVDDAGRVRAVRQCRISGTTPAWEREPLAGSAAIPNGNPPLEVEPWTRSAGPSLGSPLSVLRVYPFGVSRDRLLQTASESSVAIALADDVSEADLVLTTKTHYRKGVGVLESAEAQGKPVFVLRRNTVAQLRTFLAKMGAEGGGSDESVELEEAVQEAEEGIDMVLNGELPVVHLNPQSSHVRRIQHRIAERAQLRSHSTGREPRRWVSISGV